MATREERSTETTTTDLEVRPFRIDVPEEDLRPPPAHRGDAVARPGDGPDRSQGASWRRLQELVRYWGTDYDWRKGEAKLNAWRSS